ncbi:MAG TPA: type I DNA topoisomerase [Candidatus Acidoferrales bacterium]|nr:type I DNA topoisomerase [Candidatus Acidoferrales bacterium]
MAKNLVIVESPAKAKTLQKYLGRDYQVKASVGHVMDLPKSKLGVDIGNDFEPEYHVIHGKKKIISELKAAAKGKENIFLAPDPDREGEAIAWHIAENLGNEKNNVHRVLFNEITKRAVQEAILHPRALDRSLYEAQQTRRILDRLVGYQISPLLWKKVRRGLSAGRVQSVAVRIICEREREIQAFEPKEYWSITARLEGENPPPFAARLFKVGDDKLDPEKFRVENQETADRLVERLRAADWVVARVERKERRRFPTPPFITSRLQQEASRKLGFAPSRTMRIAQKLYEGIELGDQGAVGLITYMRTDSTRVSPDALEQVRGFILERYGDSYLPEKAVTYASKKGAQDAHEAIRPTSSENPPERIAPYLSKEELALYTLIWNRFVASQMLPAVFDQTTVDISAADTTFRATGQIMKFDGFIRVYTEGRDEERKDGDEDDESERQLPVLREGEKLRLHELLPEQHFTQPPPRFNQAALIKELEEKGIGRPSTYATIMTTILSKEYVVEDKSRRLRPTELGFLVTELLVDAFPDILNVEFTAGMEDELDKIEEGIEPWRDALKRFYGPFAKDLEHAEERMRDVKRTGQPTEIPCPTCGAMMVIKWGRGGEFLACPNYPDCKSTKNFTREADGTIKVVEAEVIDEKCDNCGKPLQLRFGRYGKFLGCSGYPECKTVRPLVKPVPTGVSCPDCREGEIMEKRSRGGKTFYSCGRYPQCKFATWDRPVPEPCPQCNAPFIVEKTTKRYGTVRRCLSEGCKYQETIAEPEAEAI